MIPVARTQRRALEEDDTTIPTHAICNAFHQGEPSKWMSRQSLILTKNTVFA